MAITEIRTARDPEDPLPPHAPRPVTVGVLESLRRHKLLAILPVVILTAAGVAMGLRHQPAYTATAKMWVNGFDLTAPGALNGYTDASVSLAATYARLASSQPVAAAAGRRLRLSPQAVEGHISASPVPQSPIFNITATSPSASQSVALSNATSQSVARFVGSSLKQANAASSARNQFQAATDDLNSKLAARDSAEKKYSDNPSASTQAAMVNARSAYDVAQARKQSLENAYQSLQSSAAAPSGNASVVNPATAAASDKPAYMQKTIFAGLVAGIVLGIALATFRANQLVRGRRRWRA